MAESAGRRNILRELSSPGTSGSGSNIPSSSLATSPTSPDETVIQQRGQKKKSATYNYDAPDPVFFKTPTKSPKKISLDNFFSPAKIPVRSSPRKRLHMSPEKLEDNEAKMAELSISGKRAKKNLNKCSSSTSLEENLAALSHSQLVELLASTMREVPDIREVVEKLCPEPDLSLIKSRLLKLQRNVYKVFPRNSWGSQDDSYCYSRVRTHLQAFKNECMEVCNRLVGSGHWPSALDYVMYSMILNHGLPDWGNMAHNKLKKIVKNSLITQFLHVIQHGNFTPDALRDAIKNLENMQEEMGGDPELEICFNKTKELLEAAKKNKAN